MAWRVAESLDKLLEQINEIAPNRSKISDGSIGDADHSNRTSDHNPWCGPGVVTARDITHDPKAGADMAEITEAVRQSKDPRVKYVIFAGRMFSSYGSSAWQWRPYSGVNAHAQHAHFSVNCDNLKDSTKEWEVGEVVDYNKIEEIVTRVVRSETARQRKILAVGRQQTNHDTEKVNIKAVLEAVKKA